MKINRLSYRALMLKPSAIFQVVGKAKQLKREGEDIIDLSIGEPDFHTSEFIKNAAIDAIRNNQTKYTQGSGILELREAISKKLKKENGLDYAPSEIVATCGGKQAIFNAMMAFVQNGQEVILPAPYWASYPEGIIISEGVMVPIEAPSSQRFKITPQQLESAITPKTVMFILNSPSNPTGMMYSKEELLALAKILRKHPQVMILSDDIYEHINWSNDIAPHILSVAPDLRERTLITNAVSKTYAMTGWRLGYVAAPKELITPIASIQSQSTSHPSSISQHAALAAFLGPQDEVVHMKDAFKKRHDFFVPILNQIKGFSCLESDGAFYAFADVKEAFEGLDGVNDCEDFSHYLLDSLKIACVAGIFFGAPGYIRFSIATSEHELKRTLERLEKHFGLKEKKAS